MNDDIFKCKCCGLKFRHEHACDNDISICKDCCLCCDDDDCVSIDLEDI